MNGFSSVSRDRLTSPPDHGWIGGKLGVRSISDRMPCTVNCLTNADTDDGTFAVYVEVPTVPRGRDRPAAIMGANLGRPSRNTEDIGGCFKIFVFPRTDRHELAYRMQTNKTWGQAARSRIPHDSNTASSSYHAPWVNNPSSVVFLLLSIYPTTRLHHCPDTLRILSCCL